FSLRSMGRAALSVGSSRMQGGSTITQQLVKNFFLTPERTLRRKLTELVMAESALLVALVKGPAVYDPHRHPARALERRNLVLRETREQNAITMDQYAAARAAEL